MANTGDTTPTSTPKPADWLALVIGNSRLHWAIFAGDRWDGSWHTSHLTPAAVASLCEGHFAAQIWPQLGLAVPPTWPHRPPDQPIELWVAGVVRSQLQAFQSYAGYHQISLDHIPLPGRYPTLGVDRALNLLGAGATYGWPVLVVDCGTALTFTAGTQESFYGGAILPGLRSQLRALHEHTDALPLIDPDWQTPDWQNIPPRWANTTPAAMLSGVFYSQLASIHDFIADWWSQFPLGQVVLTGGDSPALAAGLSTRYGTWAKPLRVDVNLMFWGIQGCRRGQMTQP